MNRPLTEEKTQTANKHMKRCLVVLVTREMQNKITARGYVSSTRLGKIYKGKNLNSEAAASETQPREGDKRISPPGWRLGLWLQR